MGIDFVPTGPGCPPELVSFTAVHAGSLSNVTVNVSVQVFPATPVPSVTLPAPSDPTTLAPAPQSAPRLGAANDVAGEEQDRPHEERPSQLPFSA